MSADRTVTEQLLVADSPPASIALSSKVRTAVPVAMAGDVKLACRVCALLRATVVPPVWRQRYPAIAPSGSDAAPANTTAAPAFTVWLAPADAVGAWFWLTVTAFPPDHADAAPLLSRACTLTT